MVWNWLIIPKFWRLSNGVWAEIGVLQKVTNGGSPLGWCCLPLFSRHANFSSFRGYSMDIAIWKKLRVTIASASWLKTRSRGPAVPLLIFDTLLGHWYVVAWTSLGDLQRENALFWLWLRLRWKLYGKSVNPLFWYVYNHATKTPSYQHV